MNVLVTGGCGYLGSVLVPRLLEEGHNVRVVDLQWFGNSLKDCEVIKGDIRRPAKSWFNKVEAVIHLAAVSNDPSAEMFPRSNYEINAMGTALVAQKAKEEGVTKFILGSTCSVYGFTVGGVSKETDSPTPKYPYGISKLMAEISLLSLGDTNFTPIILRQGTIGGASPRMRFDLVVNTMTVSAIKTGKIVVRNASLWRPVIDLRDVVRAYSNSLTQEEWVSGIFNLVQGNYTIERIGEIVHQTLKKEGVDPVLEVYDRADMRNYKASSEKALDSLGIQAEYSVESTVKSVLDFIEKEQPVLDAPKYYNLEVCKQQKGLR